MTKEEFKQRLQGIESQLHELYMDNRVLSDSAIYAYMQASSLMVYNAIAHINELHEDMDLESNINNQI